MDRLVLLGTKGGPRLTTGSSWPSASVLEVSGRPYVVDCGMGVTRQFVDAGYLLHQLHTVILTHLHSDHCLELGPLLHTAWTSSPKHTVRVHGPEGTRALVDAFFLALSFDIGVRMADERQADPSDMFPVAEYSEGLVLEDDFVRVSALRVDHPPVTECFALKFEAERSTVVFSSDTAHFPPLAEFAAGADVLVHEAMHREGTLRMCERLAPIKPNLYEHMIAGHTFADDAGRIATEAGVGRLVLQHFTPSDDPGTTPAHFEELARRTWSGPLTIGHDLQVIPLS